MDRVISYSFSQDFIKELAGWIEVNYLKAGNDLSSLAIVFGGQRPALFLKKELSSRIKTGFYPPTFFTIDEFVDKILSSSVSFSSMSEMEACYAIYDLARRDFGNMLFGRKSFCEFLPWAREIFAFIEQLDLEDVGSESLENIRLNAEIGYDVPEDINILLKGMVSLRRSFHSELKKKNAYVRGLKYLLASEAVSKVSWDQFDKVLFCNFFYLCKTEQKIVKSLYETGKAVLFFQGSQKDWPVLNKLSENLRISIEPSENTRPSYELITKSGFDLHSEAALVRETLKKLEKLDKTVVVLPEAENLIVYLSEISGCSKEFNVSMGYPLSRSSVYSLFDCIYKSQETKKQDLYYSKDYLKLLNHPLVKNLRFKDSATVTRVLVHKIEEFVLGIEESGLGGSLFLNINDILEMPGIYKKTLEMIKRTGSDVSISELKDISKELHRLLFAIWEKVKDFKSFAQVMEEWLDTLLSKSFLESYPLNFSIVERIFEIASEYKTARFCRELFPKEEIFKIFKDHIEHESVRFSGSPLKGLQVLGLLETRALSFDNVLITDVNESVLPRLKVYEPLIPRDIMISLGINRLEKEEEIQRYQFLRLLGRAKKVFLYYQESKDKERSRFIEELIWDRQKKEKTLVTGESVKSVFSVEVNTRKILLAKEEKHIQFLKNLSFSASSVNTYLHCPLRFYYQYVLKLQEKEDLLDEPEARDIGIFVHEFLEQSFSRFLKTAPKIDRLFRKFFFEYLEEKFENEFKHKMKSDSFLMLEILRFRLSSFLDNEESRDVKELVCLEKLFEGCIKLGRNNLKFKSKVDRVDRLRDGSILVLDYKTGGAELLPAKVEKVKSAEWSRRHLKKTVRSFQLPLYFHFVKLTYPDMPLNVGLYQLKNVKDNSSIKYLFDDCRDSSSINVAMSCFLNAMDFICSEILNPSVPFEADQEDSYYCGICPFFYLCR